MDVTGPHPYVRRCMNLLLLLSAMLSALSGAGLGARVPQAPVAVNVVAAVATAARVARVAIVGRPAQAMPSLGDLAPGAALAAWRVAPAAPLYLSRRRE